MEQFENYLREHDIRLTEPRREVFKILNEHDQPLTTSEILRYSQISERTSVYRTLSLFARHGITEILHIKGRERHELAEPFKAHHHHLVCTECGALESLDSDKLEKIIHRLADGHDYKLSAHHVELQGLCPNCRA